MRHGLLDLRIVPALVLGAIVAFGLFLLMHAMISNNQHPNVNGQQVNLVHFVQVQHSEQVQTKNYNHPPPPPPPKRPPPKEQIQTNTHVSHQVQQLPLNVKFNPNSMGSGSGGVYINPNAGENRGSYAPLTPMVRIPPQYPPQANYQNVQGTVMTCFTVEPDGSVSDPYVTHASSPQVRQMLGNAALQNILQWKFFPQKVDGKPVATKNVCQKIVFRIKNDRG